VIILMAIGLVLLGTAAGVAWIEYDLSRQSDRLREDLRIKDVTNRRYR
jgi:hypothetical protein